MMRPNARRARQASSQRQRGIVVNHMVRSQDHAKPSCAALCHQGADRNGGGGIAAFRLKHDIAFHTQRLHLFGDDETKIVTGDDDGPAKSGPETRRMVV
jgi:hypothetical protein